jgi:hypothetical protein
MLGRGYIGNVLLELFEQRAVVGQPPAIEHVIDPLQKALATADIRSPDVKLVVH